MYVLSVLLMALCLSLSSPSFADEPLHVALLRAQAFNNMFDGFDYYYVTIESNVVQPDGTQEVTAVASGKFLDQTKRVKVLFLVAGETLVGGQVLEENGLPPCIVLSHPPETSL
ncbi:MAG: hypothetical protein CV089_00785 [Nitrospira sp. WS110]|nr:hypothetical protein [Nitrospira sp. WS110]